MYEKLDTHSPFQELCTGLSGKECKLLSQEDEGNESAKSALELINMFLKFNERKVLLIGGGRGSVQVNLGWVCTDNSIHVEKVLYLQEGTPADIRTFIEETIIPKMKEYGATMIVLYSGFYLSILKSKEEWLKDVGHQKVYQTEERCI